MATVARFRAVVSFRGIRVGGFVGWIMWAFVHITFLTGFRNRFNAGLHWLGAFFGRARNQRTITVQQVAGRIIAMDAGLRPNETEGPTQD
jgi:NADH dehydrogenase